MTDTQPAQSRRAMLALIVLADLPTPRRIGFQTDSAERCILSLHFENLADGLAWLDHFGARYDGGVSTHGGRRWADQRPITWLGWSVGIHANDPEAAPDALPPSTFVEVAEVAAAEAGRKTCGYPGDTEHDHAMCQDSSVEYIEEVLGDETSSTSRC